MASNSTSLRSALGRARGLGSAKEGTHHWWAQRVTALALIPLTLWFVYSVLGLAAGDYSDFVYWCRNPLNATALVLFLAVAFHHAQLGMQVVIEDYVSSHGSRTALIIVVKFACYALATLSIISILSLTFGA